MDLDITQPAVFSECGRYRYLLRREFNIPKGDVMVSIGYNPSTATERDNDPTIRREIGFCASFGIKTLIKVNVFAWISPYPNKLADADDPVGPHNDRAIQIAAEYCLQQRGKLLAAWGAPKGRAVTERIAKRRFAEIEALGLPLLHLRRTPLGYPEHPLYLPGTLQLSPWLP